MASDPTLLGTIADEEENDVNVYREPDGTLVLWAPDTGWHVHFPPPEGDKLRELLDRAAMPGQTGTDT